MSYDILPNEFKIIDQPDILIFEGINVLQVRDMPEDGEDVPFVSDFFDYSIYIDADPKDIRALGILSALWIYVSRLFVTHTVVLPPLIPKISEEEALTIANGLWDNINHINLIENVQPTRPRADLILRKGKNHFIEKSLYANFRGAALHAS